MEITFELRNVTKRYDQTEALSDVSLTVERGSFVGLIGKNGAGKTTLLRHLTGLCLPTEGECRIFGVRGDELGANELARIGAVHQEARYLTWMRVEDHLRYVASFYPRWDRAREEHLLGALDLAGHDRVGELSTGNLQKLGILLAVCHHPELVLLDEPANALDPLARDALLAFLLEMLREDGCTIVISSHLLSDIEATVEQVICLDHGRLVAHIALDELKERYEEWNVSSPGPLVERFPEPWILEQEISGQQARLIVRDATSQRAAFEARHGVDVQSRSLSLPRLFPFLIQERRR